MIKWKKESASRWVSDCGRYRIWVQSRPSDGAGRVPHYAASCEGVDQWLTDNNTFAGAKEVCEDHKKKTMTEKEG